MTEITRQKYIDTAIASGQLPKDAHRMAQIISLDASNDVSKPIQFWQLFSVLGQDRVVEMVRNFYERVFADEEWFRSPFERVGGVDHHVATQASMWLDVMGGGPYYHGAEFRLNFHHTHNAMQLMNEEGAKQWVSLMVATLDNSEDLMTDDARVRPSINTFLSHFFGKYAEDFKFANRESFGEMNPSVQLKINFLNMTSDAIEALSEQELRAGLEGRGVDVSAYKNKIALVNKALSL